MAETDNAQDVILVRASAKRNGLTSLILGIGLFVLALIMFALLPMQFRLLGIFTTSAAIVAVLVGWFKIREPEHSMVISRQEIDYNHRKGNWQLQWKNVQRIDTPKVTKGTEQTTLSLVGIRVKDYEPILDAISPRLMSHMLMEQRPLLLQAPDKNCDSGNCFNDDLIEDDKFQSEKGKAYTGIQAMFGNRMAKLRSRLGYDIFINSAELDRSAEEFAELLRSCHRDVISQ